MLSKKPQPCSHYPSITNSPKTISPSSVFPDIFVVVCFLVRGIIWVCKLIFSVTISMGILDVTVEWVSDPLKKDLQKDEHLLLPGLA